jgi:hypothetical protein
MDRGGRTGQWEGAKRWHRLFGVLAIIAVAVAWAPPARATLRYGPIELSGSVDSQTLLRSTHIDEWQFVQNRNTALIRLDYEWLQSGKLIDRFDLPFIKRSKLYMLYRGVYDSFWDIGPGGRQKGVTVYDDEVGGPIKGHTIGNQIVGGNTCNPATDPACICPAGQSCLQSGLYSRIDREGRDALKFESTLREAYIDLALRDAPLSFRLGRQQVIWGETDQFRLMDIINPLDLTWHLQQEAWDKIRIPLWMVKSIWDMGDLGPISNAFTEVLWSPGDFQPGVKVEYLPAPWSVPVPNPVRSGQIVLDPAFPVLLSPTFNLQGTSFRKGDFSRNPMDASEVGIRFHGVTDIPPLHVQGLEFTMNYFYGRSRGIGAVASAPFALKIEKATIVSTPIRQNPGDPNSAPATFNGLPVFSTDITAQFIHPFTHIFGLTGNYFEGNYTNAVFRLETAYQLGAPFQSAALSDRVIAGASPDVPSISCAANALNPIPGVLGCAPIGFTKRDVWAGMLGVDHPTWIRFLNPRSTWLITGQFFWSYVNGTHSVLRGPIETASEAPYFTPPGNTQNGFGQWNNGQFAGQIERTQDATQTLADNVRQWEILTTLAATSFYAGGSIVPFVGIAIDPVNRNFLSQLQLDYFITNNLILQLRENFYSDLGSGRPSLDPWGAGGLNARRDETGIKITYQY